MDNQYIRFTSRENAENSILGCEDILSYNNSKFNLFLNNVNGLRMLNETVIDAIGYTF